MEAVRNRAVSIDDLANAMTSDEYLKAKEFYSFLVDISKCTGGILRIEREKFIKLAATMMDCTPAEAYAIISKMRRYGWIKACDSHFVVVNVTNNKG